MQRAIPLAIFAFAAAALIAAQATAERSAPPLRPYKPVAIALPDAPNDDTLIKFRATLAATAKGRIYADLARLLLPQEFFWDRDFGRQFNPRKLAVDNLAAALRLEYRGGSGWQALASFAAEATAEPMEARPGVICAPARPRFDSVAFARLLDDSNTEPGVWVYPIAIATVVYDAPEAGAAPVGALGQHFVRLLGFVGVEDEPAPGRTQWARIALPDARTGFVAPASLRSHTSERLCYIKHVTAGWRIAGYVAGGP